MSAEKLELSSRTPGSSSTKRRLESAFEEIENNTSKQHNESHETIQSKIAKFGNIF